VIWGSQLILKYVERYPAIIYIGGGVLAWTAAKMMISEPLLEDALDRFPAIPWLVYAGVLGGVLGAGFLANHGRVRARVARHLVDIVSLPAAADDRPVARMLVPVDGSDCALQTVRLVMNRVLGRPGVELHLVHVRTPFKQHVARFVARRDLDTYHRERAELALRTARDLLEGNGVPYAAHVEIGDQADRINAVARRLGAERIVIGAARKNSLTRLIEDSVTNRVIEAAKVPVEVVAGDAVSSVERIGVPACVGAALLLLIGVGL
jgi:nucleotide-binding universal stress UspA family protein